MSAPVEALLFDLGGVIVELDWERVFAHWARCSGQPVASIRQAFTFDVPVPAPGTRRDRRGGVLRVPAALAAARYRRRADRGRMEGGVRRDDSRDGGHDPRAARADSDVHLLNTNTAHHAEWAGRFAAVLEPFEKVFVSSQMALRKPSREAFEHVAREIGVAPGAILFFDDMLENVEGARAAGLQAVHVRSPQDVRDALRPWLPAT
jgi:putative hydrolase of the HAD superfamily